MKIQGSHKFVASLLGLILLVWAGWAAYAAFRLKGVRLDTIKPGRVNIVAISPQAGYKVIVANQIAYLAKVEGDFEASDMGSNADSVVGKSRLPLRELMETLQGDEKALGVLLMRLNDWDDTDTAAGTKVWTAEDLQRAIDGDEELAAKLTQDLNVGLDGVPLETIFLRSLAEGIIVDSPVKMKVKVGDQLRTLVARIQEVYQPVFCARVYGRISERFRGASDTAYIQGVYREEARPIIESGVGEDVRQSISGLIDPTRLQGLTRKPRLVLENTAILLNESHITAASFETYDEGRGKTINDVTIGLSEPGRMRLWKYSHDNRGFQLLFIVDSIAIAAPLITSELAESNVTIRRVPSRDLVEDAVGILNEVIAEKK